MNIKVQFSIKLQHPANEKEIMQWLRNRLHEPTGKKIPGSPLEKDSLKALRRSIEIIEVKA